MHNPAPDEINLALSPKGEPASVRVRIKESMRSRSFRLWIEGKTSAVLSKPKRASMKSALEFLNSNLDWLEKRLSEVGESLSLREYLKKRPHVYANARRFCGRNFREAFCGFRPQKNNGAGRKDIARDRHKIW